MGQEYAKADAKAVVDALIAKKPSLSRKDLYRKPLPKQGYANKKPNTLKQYIMREYWFLKSEYLHLKALPVYRVDTARVLEYLWLCVPELFQYTFWSRISYDKQQTLLTYMCMREERDCKIVSVTDVYIVLNGKVDVAQHDTIRRYHMGEVFGAIEIFDYVLKEGEDFPSALRIPLILEVEKASLLCLSVDDYRRIVCQQDDSNMDLIQQYAKMSFAEKKIFEVQGIVKRNKMSDMMEKFLYGNKLLPSDPNDESYEWIKECSSGKKITMDTESIYVVLEGSLRLMIEKRGGGDLEMQDEGTGDVTIKIKRNDMPLVILEAGSIISIDENFFCDEADKNEFAQDDGIVADSAVNNNKDDGNMSYAERQIAAARVLANQLNNVPEHSIVIFFDKNSRFVQIPRRIAYRALRTEATENQPLIRNELEQMGDLLKTRLSHIAPWMKGRLGVTFHMPKKPHRKLSDFELLHPKIEYVVDNTPNLDRLPEYHHFPENKLSGAHGIVDLKHKNFNTSTEIGYIRTPSVGVAAPLSIDEEQTIGVLLTQVGIDADQQANDSLCASEMAPEQTDACESEALTRKDRDTFLQEDVLKMMN